jgi:RHS repeat-associated protein
MKRTLLALAASCSALFVSPAFGQYSADPVGLRVEFCAHARGQGAYVETSIISETYSYSSCFPSGSDWEYGDIGTAIMKPGKTYTLVVMGDGGAHGRINFNAPPGYVVFVEGVECGLYPVASVTGNYYEIWTEDYYEFDIRLEKAPGTEQTLAAGQASAMSSGKALWEVGMGELRNGKPAGAIGMRSEAINANTYKPAGLFYSTDSAAVDVVWDANGLRQVFAPKALASISPINARSYEIRYYERWRVTGKSGGLWQVNDANAWYVRYVVDTPDSSGFDKLRITKHVNVDGTRSWETLLALSSGGSIWTLDDWHRQGGSVLRRETRVFTTEGSNPVETVTVTNGSETASVTRYVYTNYPWGRELTEKVEGSDASSESEKRRTKFWYHENAALMGNYGKVKAIQFPDGGWVRYDYYDDQSRYGQLYHKTEPFLDTFPSPFPDGSLTSVRTTTYDYATDHTFVRKSLVLSVQTTQPSSQYTPEDIVQVGSSSSSYSQNVQCQALGAVHKLRAATETSYASASFGHTTVTKVFQPNSDPTNQFTPGLIHSVRYPDGTLEAHAFFKGTWNGDVWGFVYNASGPMVAELIYRGVSPDFTSEGNRVNYLYQSGQDFDLEDVQMINGRSAVTTIVRDELGEVHWTDERIWNGSSASLLRGTRVTRNAFGAISAVQTAEVNTSSPNGVDYVDEYSATYSGGLLSSSTDAMGVVTGYQYDDRGRVSVRTVQGAAGDAFAGLAQPDVVSSFGYDADDRLTSESTGPTGSLVTTTYDYDSAGRLRTIAAPGPNSTALETVISPNEPARTSTVTRPGGATTVSQWYRDGRPAQVTGSAQVPVYYQYQDGGSGLQQVQTKHHPDTSAVWEATKYDWLGRVVERYTPAVRYMERFHVDVHDFAYNSRAQLTSVYHWTAGGNVEPIFRYEYDALGAVVRAGYDLDSNGALQNNGLDRYVESSSGVVWENHHNTWAWWLRQESSGFPKGDTAASVLLERTYRQLSGFNWALRSRTLEERADGQVSRTEFDLNRWNKVAVRSTWLTNVSTPVETVWYNGRKSVNFATVGETARATYDAYGRISRIDGREDVCVTRSFYPGTDFLQETHNGVNRLVHYAYNSAGRVAVETLGDNSTRRYAYNDRGQTTNRWGSAVEPTEMGYNSWGAMTSLSTFRGGSNWNSSAWPGGTPDTTSFSYDEMSGLLLTKTFADQTTEAYSWNDSGRLRKVTRSVPGGSAVEREWFYQDWANPSADLEDSAWHLRRETATGATEVVYGYFRDGTLKQTSDASGNRDFSYNDQGRLYREAMPQLFNLGGQRTWLTRSYGGTAQGQRPGAPLQVLLGSSADIGCWSGQTRLYNSGHGLLDSIWFGNQSTPQRYNIFGYRSGTALPETSTLKNGDDTLFWRSINWDTWRDAPTQIMNMGSGHEFGTFRYPTALHDERDRRRGELRYGEVPAKLGENFTYGSWEKFTLDERRLTGSALHEMLATWQNESTSSQLISGTERSYACDNAGNRTSATEGSSSRTFSPNSVNQCSSVGGTTHTWTAGNLTADGAATYGYNGRDQLISYQMSGMTVNYTYDYLGRRVQKAVTGSGLRAEYFNNQNWTGTPALVRIDQTVDFGWGVGSPGSGVGADNFSARWTGKVFVPTAGTWTFYTVTDDGVHLWVDDQQLIEDPTYHGDTERSGSIYLAAGEHSIEMRMFEGGGGATARLSWSGPGMAKQIIGSSYLGPQTPTTRYIYDGWKLVAETDGAGALLRTYVWAEPEAAGVGAGGGQDALVAIQENGTTYAPVYDGRGNVTGIVNTSTNTLVAAYRYDPFGNIVSQWGGYASKNPIGFESQYTDRETGLVYYSHRVYSPRLGRFLQRDPLGESVSSNLYDFAGNDPLNSGDYLGLARFTTTIGSFGVSARMQFSFGSGESERRRQLEIRVYQGVEIRRTVSLDAFGSNRNVRLAANFAASDNPGAQVVASADSKDDKPPPDAANSDNTTWTVDLEIIAEIRAFDFEKDIKIGDTDVEFSLVEDALTVTAGEGELKIVWSDKVTLMPGGHYPPEIVECIRRHEESHIALLRALKSAKIAEAPPNRIVLYSTYKGLLASETLALLDELEWALKQPDKSEKLLDRIGAIRARIDRYVWEWKQIKLDPNYKPGSKTPVPPLQVPPLKAPSPSPAGITAPRIETG